MFGILKKFFGEWAEKRAGHRRPACFSAGAKRPPRAALAFFRGGDYNKAEHILRGKGWMFDERANGTGTAAAGIPAGDVAKAPGAGQPHRLHPPGGGPGGGDGPAAGL